MGANEVMPCLQRLLKDSDTDVRFYAAEAIDSLKQGGGSSSNEKPAAMETDGDETMVVAST